MAEINLTPEEIDREHRADLEPQHDCCDVWADQCGGCKCCRDIRAAVATEQQRLRQVFLSIAEHHKLPAGAVLLFDTAVRAAPEPPDA